MTDETVQATNQTNVGGQQTEVTNTQPDEMGGEEITVNATEFATYEAVSAEDEPTEPASAVVRNRGGEHAFTAARPMGSTVRRVVEGDYITEYVNEEPLQKVDPDQEQDLEVVQRPLNEEGEPLMKNGTADTRG